MDGLVTFLIRRPGSVLISFGVVLLVAVLLTGRLHFQQDILAALPQNDRAFQVLQHIVKATEGQDTLYFLIKKKETQGPDAFVTMSDALISGLRDLSINGEKGFSLVTGRKEEAVSLEDFQELLDQYLQQPDLFITDNDLKGVRSFLASPAQMEEELKRSLALLATPGANQLSRIISLDPLNFRRFLVDKLQKLHSGIIFADGPYMLSENRGAMLLVAHPAFPANDRVNAQALFAATEALAKKFPDLTIGLTGGYAMAVQEEALMRGDILGAIVGSAIGIGLLFLFAYRRLLVLGFIILPLGVGLQLGLGAMALIWGEVHLVAVAFSAVVLGLGVDFAIHVYDRYVSERLLGTPVDNAARFAITRTGKAVLVGCLTTLTAFSVLSLTGSLLVRQIGLLVSLGLLFCLGTILWALPAWLIWSERYKWGRSLKPFRLMGMDRLGSLVSRKPRWALIISFIIFIVAIPGITKMSFEKDLMSLHPQGLESISVRQDIQKLFGGGEESLLVTWQGQGPDSLWQEGRKIDAVLDRFAAQGEISSWSSLSCFSAGHHSGAADIDRTRVESAFQQFDLDMETFTSIPLFLDALSEKGAYTLKSCADLEQLPKMYHRFFICDSKTVSGIDWVYAQKGTAAALGQALAEEVDPGILVISPETAISGLMEKAKTELWETVGLACFIVMVILLAFFKGIKRILFAILPTLLGLLTTMGVMGYLDVRINLINFIIVPILIGIGLDDGIHIMDRFREHRDVQKTLATTGRSVLLTTLTTILGFGSLAFAEYHVLAGMGLLTIVGVSACFFYSTVTLPALLQLKTKESQF